MPRLLARLATSMLFMSWTITSQEVQAARLIISIASVHAAHPALNTSIFRLSVMSLFDHSRGLEYLTLGGSS